MREHHAGAREFSIRLSINYEDTDAAGVVYYGNYPGYMERARNACLRQLGFPLRCLERKHGAVFAVTEAHLKYRAPAVLDDEIEVALKLLTLRRASLVFAQQVRCDGRALVDARIALAMLGAANGKPRRMPAELADALRRWSCGEAARPAAQSPR
ncbi:MAG: acyl-CoA thioesterase [Gammaproteobacteria bacterium]